MAKTPSHEKIGNEQTVKVANLAPPQVELVESPFTGTKTVAEKYEILEKLGTGGMSTVYKVRHVHLDKTLALKLLHKATEPASISRFQQEAKASSLLEHPNIVRVHDFGMADGQPYMSMDFLQGKTLSEILKNEGPLNTARFTRIFGQICGALAHAHQQGVVHRDIKPSNIVIKGDDAESEQAIVVDFGIAKIIDDADEGLQNLTRTGDIFGTPYYMSPEQSQGLRVDARSDIYSLGCVMYEAITGKVPFCGDSIYHTIHMQITEAPPPFPEALRKTQEGRQLEALVLKAMAKSPADRYKYVLQFSSELKEIEYGSGWWSDMRAFSRILSGRLKAAEKRTVLTKWTVRICTVLAIVLSTVFVVLPGQIQGANSEVQRLEAVIKLANKMFGNSFKSDSPYWADPQFEAILKKLERLCRNDKRQNDVYLELNKRTAKARVVTLGVTAAILKNLSESGLGLQAFREAQNEINRSVTLWTEVSKIGHDFFHVSYEELEQEKLRLHQMQTQLLLSRLLAIPVGILLLIGLLRSAIDMRRFEKIPDPGSGIAKLSPGAKCNSSDF